MYSICDGDDVGDEEGGSEGGFGGEISICPAMMQIESKNEEIRRKKDSWTIFFKKIIQTY